MLQLIFSYIISAMKQSQLFTKTRKEAPKDEVAKNAELLIRGGYIHKEMAGVYTYLPLGLRVLNNINGIIRDEMNKVGGQEILLTSLQEKDAWEKTNRWVTNPDVDVWFTTKLKNETELGLAFTHEEPLTRLMKEHIRSYRDLPVYPYQIQTKFRNELRPKGGILRGREFLMKDLYSFSKTQKEHDDFYEKSKVAYKNIFNRIGIGDKTFITFASGGTFSRYSHEFQTITSAGEDTIYLDRESGIAINKEVYIDEVIEELGLKKENLVEERAIEVGNIFKLGTKFSESLGLTYTNESGNSVPVVMGSYGIGPSRLMGTIVELLSDEKGIVWPEAVAPFRVHLVILGNSPEVAVAGDMFYEKLKTLGVETLYDDRDLRPGEKFADSDLIGIPTRVVISEKTLQAGKLEVKKRIASEAEMMDEEEFLRSL